MIWTPKDLKDVLDITFEGKKYVLMGIVKFQVRRIFRTIIQSQDYERIFSVD